ncbi:MAG: chromosome segregation protein SMC [SAR86 cluster bacterium]|uniref:Chromosome partition protein Smc n=1 Tax=SAR86 cluster bacterium TaxID=2030880 RepID=A0A2A5C811_9GAMM|nr:chromosome segregation protein SMC [bacterium AH-315-I11]PCJ39610.1 MAG: chromosome segregation protein SMC [SAR86 cluster bacterium]
MRLKSIKLAGFKSFVDPTTVHLPTNLCAIVGPNGCGKSNIIDAVRWVLGESSAKNLRGEQMTDVIFKGSSTRKPVGQATVELIFDNSDRTIKGQYASFNEVSVKRVVNTEAQSTYLLNGTKCRRRDITDIFLGTGLGPRSYSIIEQGMVSRLIESKPEELRVFIEEAAGISKYKERRRETENRIKRTKENLERLTDIREELGRQLQHLQRQAKAAERYKEYKQQERDTQANLNVLRWRDFDSDVRKAQQTIRDLEVKLEASIASFRAFEAEIEQQREANTGLQESYQKVQASFYSLGSEISKIEQNIEHQRQRQLELSEELGNIQINLTNAESELLEDKGQIIQLQATIKQIEPELNTASEQGKVSSAALEEAEKAMSSWQQDWDHFNTDSAEATRLAEVEQQRIRHLENIVERGIQRQSALSTELEGLHTDNAEQEIVSLSEKVSAIESDTAALQEENLNLLSNIDESRVKLKESNSSLAEKRSALQIQIGRQASLEALQQAALGKQEDTALEWLEQHNLSKNKRLLDEIKVEAGWELAVETVLGKNMQAVCVDDLSSLDDLLSSYTSGLMQFVDNANANSSPNSGNVTSSSLKSKVVSQRNLGTLLDGVYVAETLNEALALRTQLLSHESLVTRDGIWLGGNWLRIAKGFDEEAGMLKRQEELLALTSSIESLNRQISESSAQTETLQSNLSNFEQEKEAYLDKLTALNKAAANLSAERSTVKAKVEQTNERKQRIKKEIEELQEQVKLEQENIATARVNLQDALDRMAKDTEKREELLQEREQVRSTLESTRQKAAQDKDSSHALTLQHQTQVTQLSSLNTALDRITAQVQTYMSRQQHIQTNLKQSDDPVPALKQALEEKLSSRISIENEMNEAKGKVDEVEHELRELEKRRTETQENSQGIKDELATKRLNIEGASVKREVLEQQIAQASYNLEEVLLALPEELVADICEEELEKLGARIQRLGPINLAAIDEYTSQSERKTYLDQQNEDLEKALNTLQNAIRKIDRETRTRFKETFDKINQGLQDLFPKVFGGGHAYLDMVGDDLLDAGVTIMARPPGKRNSTIHLLSGGEKAMTAIALVFSIFHLNPSPFCMLDEVDAPLDDANISRYANLVKEMSSVIQFIFITHNRLTMESANQLMGVTMQEPGVSRLVSVDIAEAAEMVAT